MSTYKQLAAYRNILATRHDEHMKKTYGMLPIAARFLGKCGCGRIFGEGTGWTPGTPCRFDRGAKIAKFQGAWWNLACIDRAKLEEFHATARFVREVRFRSGEWKGIEFSNRAEEAQHWSELLELEPERAATERVTDRQEVAQ